MIIKHWAKAHENKRKHRFVTNRSYRHYETIEMKKNLLTGHQPLSFRRCTKVYVKLTEKLLEKECSHLA